MFQHPSQEGSSSFKFWAISDITRCYKLVMIQLLEASEKFSLKPHDNETLLSEF